jgi:hypothetical protein
MQMAHYFPSRPSINPFEAEARLNNTGRLLVSGTKTRQMHAGSLPAQSPSRGSGDRRAVYDYKNVITIYLWELIVSSKKIGPTILSCLNPHQTSILESCSGTSWISLGLLSLQYLLFCVFTCPFK